MGGFYRELTRSIMPVVLGGGNDLLYNFNAQNYVAVLQTGEILH